MTCREVKQALQRDGWDGRLMADGGALSAHVESCRRCREAFKIAGLSSALFQSLREEAGGPGPAFYPRLRARLTDAEFGRPDISLLQVLGLARRIIPALAVGVVLLAGVTLSMSGSRSPLPVHVAGGADIDAFSLEEVNLPGVAEPLSRDQMLAFVLMKSAPCNVQGAMCEDEGSRSNR